MPKYRIAVCEHTKKEIIQEQLPSGDWLCLHYEDELTDQASVDAFKAGADIE